MGIGLNFIVVIFLVFSLSGCDQASKMTQPGAKEVLESYLEATLNNQPEDAYRYISTDDKTVKTFSEYQNDDDTSSPLLEIVSGMMSYEVLEVVEVDGEAKATVNISIPDMGVLLRDLMGVAFVSAFNKQDTEKVQQAIAERYQSGDIPMTVTQEEFYLIEERSGWKLFLNWRAKRIAQEEKEAVNNLLKQAKELRRDDKLAEALAKYEQVLALNSELVEAQVALEELDRQMQEIALQRQYMSKVELYDVTSKYYETYGNKRVAGVKFKVKNTGDRTLRKVQVTVYFKDPKGVVISEKVFHPVLVTEYSFGRDNSPLKPNYIWEQEKGRFYSADSVPTEWKEGYISAAVTDIAFLD